jgi:large subunit ribosomal protein L14e
VLTTKQALVDGPSSDSALAVPRHAISLSDCLLSQIAVEGLPRGARRATVKKFWDKNEIDSKWKETNWFKKREQMRKRKQLSDFDRFKVMRLKKQRRFEQRKTLAGIRSKA